MKLFNVMVLATVAIAGKNNGDGRNENIPDGKFCLVFLLESPFLLASFASWSRESYLNSELTEPNRCLPGPQEILQEPNQEQGRIRKVQGKVEPLLGEENRQVLETRGEGCRCCWSGHHEGGDQRLETGEGWGQGKLST